MAKSDTYLKNWTSEVSPNDSAGQIEELLQELGADRIYRMRENGEFREIRFEYTEPNSQERLQIQIKPDYERVASAFCQYSKAPNLEADDPQVHRTAWKNELERLQLLAAMRAGEEPNLAKMLMQDIVTDGEVPLYDRLFGEAAEAAARDRLLTD